jgi:hypothetical protein
MLDDLVEGAIGAAIGAGDALEANSRRDFWVGLAYNLLGVLLVLGTLPFAYMALSRASKLWWAGAVVCLVGAAAAFIYSFYVRRVRST